MNPVEELIKNLEKKFNVEEQEDNLSFESVRDRLVEIAKLLLCDEETHRNRAFFYLGCLINDMDRVVEDIANEGEENGNVPRSDS